MKGIININMNKTALSMAVFFIFIGFGWSQTYTNETEPTEAELVESSNLDSEVIRYLGLTTTRNQRNSELSGNQLSLQQIGDYNNVEVKVAANASEINITQNGNYNLSDLEYKVNTAIANLTQSGDKNIIKDYVYNGSEDISLDLQQQGDNLYFERFGSNELTKSLQFKQTEASPTIIIRSFQ